MISELILYKNTEYPLHGTVNGAAFAWPGTALSANISVIHAEFPMKKLLHARWLLVWNPNTDAGFTAVRLVSADLGPTNIAEIAVFRKNNYHAPKVDGIDITNELNAILAGGVIKQLCHQTAGNGAAGALIYSSVIECVWSDLPA